MPYDIEELIEKYKAGKLTKAERDYLMQWYNSFADSQSLDSYANEDLLEDINELKYIDYSASSKKVFRFFYKWPLVAAAFVLVGTISFILIKNRLEQQTGATHVVAGSQKAELILHSGEKIILDSLTSFAPIVKKNLQIDRLKDGTLKYTALTNNDGTNSYDELSIPKGGEYKIQLVDGTKVWLNAGSKLRFYTSSKSTNREVWLEGEGYFEVQKNAERPFLVHTNQQKIRVTGTAFNVSCNNSKTQTTLIEGGVSINDGKVHLKPNEQLTTQDKVDHALVKVDVADVVAWKNGYFIFKDYPLDEVLRNLEAWYDLQFTSKTTLKNHKIWATMSKYKDIDEVLHIIELTGVAKFKREGRRVEIRQ